MLTGSLGIPPSQWLQNSRYTILLIVCTMVWKSFGATAILYLCIFPPVWVLLSSFKDIKEFFAVPPTLIPRTFHIDKLWDT